MNRDFFGGLFFMSLGFAITMTLFSWVTNENEETLNVKQKTSTKTQDTDVIKCVCETFDSNGNIIELDCSECDGKFYPRPAYTLNWNVDSLEREMEKKLIDNVNKHRKNLGLSQLTFNRKVFTNLTQKHTLYQDTNNHCTHDENGVNFIERFDRFYPQLLAGENVSSHQEWNTTKESEFFKQYMGSEPHRKMIENPVYNTYATSVKYSYDNNTFYNTLNLVE